MFDLELGWIELVARGVLVYVAVLIMVRLSGKRTIGEFSPFDVIVLLLLSEAAGGSLTGGDKSLQGGLIVIATLIALNYLAAFASARSRKIDALLEGKAVVLVRDGQVDQGARLRNHVPEDDLLGAMRASGIRDLGEVELAILEPGGDINFFCRKSAQSAGD